MIKKQVINKLETLPDDVLLKLYNSLETAYSRVYTMEEFLEDALSTVTQEEAFKIALFSKFYYSDNYCQFDFQTNWLISYPTLRDIPFFMENLVRRVITRAHGNINQVDNILSSYNA